MMGDDTQVLIIGAGLAGLACAVDLHRAGIRVQVIEAADGAGGRVRSDLIDGFVCDRGFQVLLEAYPQARQRLDYQRLQLGRFRPGAILMQAKGRQRRIADPWRWPWAAVSSLAAPGGLMDKLRVLRMARRARRQDLQAAFLDDDGDDHSTRQWLEAQGFSATIIDGFFAPWFGGVFCDRSLATSARLFRTYYAALSQGSAVLPAGGMGMIPLQLVEALPPGSITYGCRALSVSPGQVICADGHSLAAPIIVVATEAPAAAVLLGEAPPPPGVGVRSLWFSADDEMRLGPWIALDASGAGPINHLAVPSQVAADYAPPGKQVVVATALGEHRRRSDLESAARQQLRAWFGPQVDRWRLLADQDIMHAQPRQLPGDVDKPLRLRQWQPGCWLIGDHCSQASIDGALASGAAAARAIAADFSH